MSLGREFYQVGSRVEKALALVEDRQIFLGPGITSELVSAERKGL